MRATSVRVRDFISKSISRILMKPVYIIYAFNLSLYRKNYCDHFFFFLHCFFFSHIFGRRRHLFTRAWFLFVCFVRVSYRKEKKSVKKTNIAFALGMSLRRKRTTFWVICVQTRIALIPLAKHTENLFDFFF